MLPALILEGGGTRGAYTAGVLDVFIENNIYFDVTYGISAGACNALSYLSKQHGRNRDIYMKYASDKRYLSFGLLLRTGSLFGFDFIFGELSTKLLPFYFDEFYKSDMDIRIGTTDCTTGKPVFFDKNDLKGDFTAVIASSSLPVISNIVEYRGLKLLDGGISAPIPIDCAIKDGMTKNVVVLTREESYVKENKSDFPKILLKSKYKKYPEFIKTMENRAAIYNGERELCRSEREKGNAFIIQPSEPITISRYCTDTNKLKEVYDLGVKDTKNNLAEIRRFVELNS